MSSKVADRVLAWLHQGYPDGIPQQDYFPLLAVLSRSLSEDDVVKIAQTVLQGNDSGGATAPEIRAAIHLIAESEPTPQETRRVTARLAAAGGPLAVPAR